VLVSAARSVPHQITRGFSAVTNNLLLSFPYNVVRLSIDSRLEQYRQSISILDM
jgi:hypothetical protein